MLFRSRMTLNSELKNKNHKTSRLKYSDLLKNANIRTIKVQALDGRKFLASMSSTKDSSRPNKCMIIIHIASLIGPMIKSEMNLIYSSLCYNILLNSAKFIAE